MRWLSSLMSKFGQRGGGKKGVGNLKKLKKNLIGKKYNLEGWQFKGLFKYYKFCSKHFSIRPSLGGENWVEGKNIQIYE